MGNRTRKIKNPSALFLPIAFYSLPTNLPAQQLSGYNTQALPIATVTILD
jgi:hypothetical protein